MLILECSQGCYGRTDGRTDGSITISLRNFVEHEIKVHHIVASVHFFYAGVYTDVVTDGFRMAP